jgi:hypothetical protein
VTAPVSQTNASQSTTKTDQERQQLAAAQRAIDSLKALLNAGPGKQ